MQSEDGVIVVGGGLGGLAAACTLAARGHDVRLFEANKWLGGKAAVLEAGGFRFDMGPTIVTLPSVLETIFAEAERQIQDELELVELDPQWRCFFEDGSLLDLGADVDEMAEKLAEFSDVDGIDAGYRGFLDESERLEDISQRFFFWHPVGSFRDMMGMEDSSIFGAIKAMSTMKLGHTVAGRVRHYLQDSRVAQMADHFTQYVGSSPFAAPAVLCGIAYMQTKEGISYPLGGTRAIPVALAELAEDLGVDMHTKLSVRRILHEDEAVTGVVTSDGERHTADVVVSGADSVRTHRELIGGEVATAFERGRSCEPACSGVVLYLGLKRRYDHLSHHNFVFSRNAREEFEAIYEKGEPAPDPTCYVCAPASTEPGVAPEGGEALYVLVHTPYLRSSHDWDVMLPEYRQTIIEKLERTGGMEDLEDEIEFESALTPQDINDRYSVLQGAIYGLASHGRFTGALKPSNRSPHLRGLYLAGGSAHPGPGMPMALMSGWIAADAVDRDRNEGQQP